MKLSLTEETTFRDRHIGPTRSERQAMLKAMGVDSMEAFLSETLPPVAREPKPLGLPSGISEADALARIKAIADKNKVEKCYIGGGYYPTTTPSPILRNLFENPGWYTAYTPYQAEVSQGRLEALMNFQKVCVDLSGLPLAIASLLDEGTAAAEAMAMAKRVVKGKETNVFFVDRRAYPQTIDVVRTRAKFHGFEVVVGDAADVERVDCFGALFQYVGAEGDVADLAPAIAAAKKQGAFSIVACDPMALVLLKSPGELGADCAIGNMQRFGVPMGFGGPHPAYFAFREERKRQAPGRIISWSIDRLGKPCLRMALQTREQHIRREKANSNICTSQVLLANMAGMYAVYHGPEGLGAIARRIHGLACAFCRALPQIGLKAKHDVFFGSVCVETDRAAELFEAAQKAGYELGRVSEIGLLVAVSEQSTVAQINELLAIFAQTLGKAAPEVDPASEPRSPLPQEALRADKILQDRVFSEFHSETKIMRYMKHLESKDVSLAQSMISLGSCTMKLNSASSMIPVSWNAFAGLHPFAPDSAVQGYKELIDGLEADLKAITGMEAVSFQPNSGASGEYAGMVTIRRYLEAAGQGRRKVCLIPRSAHGTNPASATMAGLELVTVASDDNGSVDVEDLRQKAESRKDELAALMITYPSTHGAFEEGVVEICRIIHENGGQVYMDGANMNAQVGLMVPAALGADVLHMNLHKTFGIPHGGGGPGVGPIAVKKHLIPYLPGHCRGDFKSGRRAAADPAQSFAVSSAAYGSAGVLAISWMYVKMMGGQGLTEATQSALLNANYVAAMLKDEFPILYVGAHGRVAHECIVDMRPLKGQTGITETDVAKRLMDYGFHAPTLSFPVPGTLMVEPTESESKTELDRFVAALKSIKQEALRVASGDWPKDDNPLVNAPHPAATLLEGEWAHPYTREEAAYPLPWVKAEKYWPTVNRVDEVYGDRHVSCEAKTDFGLL